MIAFLQSTPAILRWAAAFAVVGLAAMSVSCAQPPFDMAPRMSAPRGVALDRDPRVRLAAGGFTLENGSLVAEFSTEPSLRLVSLRNEYLARNVLAHPGQTHLFVTEVDGKRFNAEDWRVQAVRSPSPSTVVVSLALPEHGLTAQITFGIDRESLSLGLKTTNASTADVSWKTVFPEIGGLQLSDNPDDDYYFFPLWGGAIASENANLRSFYGAGSAWWQMVDAFSPGSGGGVSMRSLDTTGIFKGIALRKGMVARRESTFDRPVTSYYMSPDMGWTNSLEPGPGLSIAFEFLKFTRPAGGSVVAPRAALAMHAGDWHQPMERYADWAHRVWQWRPLPSRLRDVWNIQHAGWGQKPLFADGKWRTDFIDGKADASELMSWWQWSDKGPWGTPMDALEEKLGKPFYERYKQYWVINPANGKLQYPLNRGDYDYSSDWGGLDGLRKELDDIRAGGQVAMLYVDPVTVDDNTRLGRRFGRKFGVMNSRWVDPYRVPLDPPGYVANFGGWQMDIDTVWYQRFLVGQVARIARDTGVDGIRFDEFGSVGYVDSSPHHRHVFAEPGQNAWLQATTRICALARQALDGIKPDFILTSEHVGYDYLAATLDGSLDLESSEALRPVSLNVFRFYFPEHKLYDQGNRLDPHNEEQRFWNAVGAFGELYSPSHHAILMENGDVFDGGKATPLVPTLVGNVYANLFSGGSKSIHLIYNATGSGVNRSVIAAPSRVGFHYFDLLHGEEKVPGEGAIAMEIPPDHVAVLALLPEVLRAKRVPEGWQVQLGREVPNAVVATYTKEGTEISRNAITDALVLPSSSRDPKAAYAKLFSGRYLLDARALAP